jgi:tRNA pseudouridine38-40 synthase
MKLTNWLVKYSQAAPSDKPFAGNLCRKSAASDSFLRTDGAGCRSLGLSSPLGDSNRSRRLVRWNTTTSVADCAHSETELQTWKLTLAYDGTDFQGWQVQPGQTTIQGELQAALGRITGETPLPQGSGRTDAGVHALAQVASFALRAPIPPENLHRALNRTLPASIRILDARTVRSTFHARHSAVAKTYEYRIFREAVCPPFIALYVYPCPWTLDFNALNACARRFEGEHDFQSFAANAPDLAHREGSGDEIPLDHEARLALTARPETTIRTIYRSAWEKRRSESGELFVYSVRGNGFLHHMVRNLVGTMLDVGRGHLALDEIQKILAARDRSTAGPTAPARGLFLVSVEYPPEESRALGF